MGFVERMKWWQWTLLSLVLGAVLAYVNTGGADTSVDHSSVSPSLFESGMLVAPWVDPKDPSHREPLMRDVVIHPVQEVPLGDKLAKYQIVSFTVFSAPTSAHPSGTTETQYVLAPFPYEPSPRRNANARNRSYPAASVYRGVKGDTLNSVVARFYTKDPEQGERALIQANPVLRDAKGPADLKIVAGRYYWVPWDPAAEHTVSDFVQATNQFLKTRDGGSAIPIAFHYRWWENSKYGYQIWMVGTFLIVGVLWPVLLTVMVKGGLGSVTPEEYDLSRFKGGPEPDGAKPAAVAPTAGDMQRLRELEESLAASLKASATAAPLAEAPDTPVEPEVKKLAGTAAEAPAAPTVEQEDKDYTGEYYPVAHTIKKPEKKE